ncbi:conserved hypothetical protein [Ricinus communis]|uniref:Uncharacterized protein n=1 Tax=Ricinus communis TaxID=3988 RepID=B9T1I3_RICCO|nr:conserved hypothetical protein [Ricinus communis]
MTIGMGRDTLDNDRWGERPGEENFLCNIGKKKLKKRGGDHHKRGETSKIKGQAKKKKEKQYEGDTEESSKKQIIGA